MFVNRTVLFVMLVGLQLFFVVSLVCSASVLPFVEVKMPGGDFDPEQFLEQILTRTSVSKLKKNDIVTLVEHLELSDVIPVQDLLKPALVAHVCAELLKLGFFGEEAIKEAEGKAAAERAAEKEHILIL